MAGWPVAAAVGIVDGTGVSHVGPTDLRLPWASVTKILAALAVWVAVEEGTVTLDDPAGPPGSSIRHLLAHASGLAPDDNRVLAAPATRRIYSNRGIELALEVVAEAAGMTWSEYLAEGVFGPLGLEGTVVESTPASGGIGPLDDLLLVARELRRPTLVSAATLAEATAPAWPGLSGVLPGYGVQAANDWGLGVELRAHKHPHWTGHLNSPATFGHFGRSGSFLWVDPAIDVAVAGLADQPFGPWAVEAWPSLADAVVTAAASA